MEEVENAMEIYYKLKDKYEDNLSKEKLKIFKNKTLDKSTKIEMLKNLQPGCINCNNKGKTLFMQKDNILIAKCQAKKEDNTPGCNLDIMIDRGDFEQIYSVNNFIIEEDEEFRKKIIMTKLDFLFGFISEDEAMSKFMEDKNEYEDLSKQKTHLITEIKKILGKEKQPRIKEVKLEILKEIENLRIFVKDNSISDAISLYINKLTPLLTELRSLLYVKNYIMCNDGFPLSKSKTCIDDIYYLIQDPYTYNETLIEFKPPKVIKLDK